MDPNFGLDAFPPEEKDLVKKRIKNLLVAAQMSIETQVSSNIKTNKTSRVEALRSKNYVYYKEKTAEEMDVVDKIDTLLDKFIQIVSDHNNTDALDFWRMHEIVFPGLELLAKKYLSVQASSAACERMFSIAGHIFSVKRRRLGIKFFTQLLLLKLNEDLID